MSNNMTWDIETEKKFQAMVAKMPVFHRRVAASIAFGRAIKNAQERNAAQVEEVDVICAFFQEVPKTFYSLMIRLMDDVKFDYKKYGYAKQKAR